MGSDPPFLDKLRAAIERWPASRDPARRFAVAFSGGLDSTVLLTALCRLDLRDAVRALHIDHGLHPNSADWERHCREAAAALGVAYRSERVQVDAGGDLGPEGAARQARYAALRELLAPGDILLTAHHADDQLETVLLRLLRGSGVRGLRGVPELCEFAPGYLARPLLGFSRAEIRAEAERLKLHWLEDPANRDLRYDRNFVRLRVLPALLERWPAAPRLAGRLTAQMQDAEQILTEVAVYDARNLAEPRRIAKSELTALAPSRQRNLLRYLIRQLGLTLPTARQLEELRGSLFITRADAQTQVQWPGAQARLYRNHLYLFEPLPPGSGQTYRAQLSASRPWSGPEGRLRFEPAGGAEGLPESWVTTGLELRFRAGGERFRPLHRAHRWALKRWFQQQAVVPWMRDRIPLLYRYDSLVAVGDLWVGDQVREAEPGEPRWRVAWTAHPPVT